MEVTADQFQVATDRYEGYCTYCDDFVVAVTDGTAEGKQCPQCTRRTVIGAWSALMRGLIKLREER